MDKAIMDSNNEDQDSNSQSVKMNGHKPKRLLRQIDPGLVPATPIDPGQVPFPLQDVASAVVGLRTEIPSEAHTAELLGTEREGSAVVIDETGLVVTIGYLLLESRAIEIEMADGDWTMATFVGYDFETGFGLARATANLGVDPVQMASSDSIKTGQKVVLAGNGGVENAIQAEVSDRREFAGYWEYLIDDAIFTMPFYPNWSGAALLDMEGRLAGIGSLFVEDATADTGGKSAQGNMFVPIDLLRPLLQDLVREGRIPRRPRPWLGMFTMSTPAELVVTHLTIGGPADRAGIKPGDVILRVGGHNISGLSDLYRKLWALGDAGIDVSLTIIRESAGVELIVKSGNRYDYFKTPRP